MRKVNCFNIVSCLIYEATNQFQPCFELDNRKMDIMQQICSDIDMFADECECKGYEISIDEITMKISIGLLFETFVINKGNKRYDPIAKNSELISLSIDNENVLLSFVFSSVWNKRNVEV